MDLARLRLVIQFLVLTATAFGALAATTGLFPMAEAPRAAGDAGAASPDEGTPPGELPLSEPASRTRVTISEPAAKSAQADRPPAKGSAGGSG